MRIDRTVIATFLAIVLLPTIGAAQKPDPAERGEREAVIPVPFTLLEGQTSLGARPANVRVRTWIVHNKERVQAFPEQGLLLCELRGGVSMTTILDGKRQVRKQGDFWTVPAGTTMTIETGRYSVVVQTIAFDVSGAAVPK